MESNEKGLKNEADATSKETVSDLDQNEADVAPENSEPGPSPDGALDESDELANADPVKCTIHENTRKIFVLFRGSFLLSGSNPTLSPKKRQHRDGHDDHQHPGCIVAVRRMQLRHVVEIHSVNAGDES